MGDDPAEDEKMRSDDGKSDEWFPALRIWFHAREEKGDGVGLVAGEGDRLEEREGLPIADEGGADEDAVHGKDGREKMPFRWPWQSDEEGGKGIDAEGRRDEGKEVVDVHAVANAKGFTNVKEVEEGNEVANVRGSKDGKEEKEKVPFRWPWQKEEELQNDNAETRNKSANEASQAPVVKKVSHSDSKPGGSFTNVSPGDIKPARKQQREIPTEWQERMDSLIKLIAPNVKSKELDTSGSEKDHSYSPQSHAAENGTHNKSAEIEKPSRTSSVSELYSPPGEYDGAADPVPSSHDRRPRWPPKLSWTQKDQVESQSSKEEKVTTVSEQRPRTGPRTSKISAVKKKPQDATSKLTPPLDSTIPQDRQLDSETTVLDVVDFSDSREDESDQPSLETQQRERTEQEPVVPLPTVATSQLRITPLDIVSIPQRDVAAIRLIFGSETFFATETLSPPGGLIFRGNLRGEPKATLAKLEERLAARLGDKYTLCLAEGEEDLRPVVVVVPTARDKRPATPRQRVLAVIIALFTVTTCLTRGLYAAVYKPIIQAFYPMTKSSRLAELFALPSGVALITSAAIGFVILASQIVQRMVASRHGTRIALPYFIPSVQLGSFGAVIQLASPTPSRAALFDIALAGAATLVVLSLSLLLVGLRLSTIFPTVVPVPMSTVSSSVIIGFLTQHVPQGQILVDYGRSLIGLHPLAVIGANCLTIAALNLLPIRQLDGGRIISALYGRRTAVVTSRVTVLFLLLASTKSPYFVVFLAAVTFGPWSLDRPAKNELTEPNGFRTVVGYLFMLLMIGVLLPFPASKFYGTL